MIEPLPHYLTLLRNTVDRLRNIDNAEDRDAVLDQTRLVLSRMMVDATIGPQQKRDAAADFARALGTDPASAQDMMAQGKAVAARLAMEGVGPLAKASLAADQHYIRAYDAAIQGEIAQPIFERAAVSVDPSQVLALRDFIRARIAGEDAVEIADVRLTSMGYSKKTILVTLSGNRVLPSEIVIRLDQALNFLGTSVVDEYQPILALRAHGVPVPQPFALEDTGDVLGHPFIIFARAAGVMPGLIHFPPPRNDRLTANIARSLAAVHTTPFEDNAALKNLKGSTSPYIDDEIEKCWADWTALTDYASPTLDVGFAWIRANVAKAYGRRAMIHNDFNYHNFLADGDEVTAVLDWEFVHIGNPAADLGYFKQEADFSGGFDHFLAHYAAAGGVVPSQDELDFYYVWAHLRFAIMSFQSEAALNEGRYDDIRYATPGVTMLRKSLVLLGDKLAELMG